MSGLAFQPSDGAPVDFPFAEKNVRHALGLCEDDMRALRKTQLKPADFVYHKKAVFLAPAAVEKICAAARVHFPDKTAAQPDAAHCDPVKKTPPKTETLLVVRTNLANKHMLIACAPADDPTQPRRPLRVRVRSSANFVFRMEIPAQLVEGYTDLYDLARAIPRNKGKW